MKKKQSIPLPPASAQQYVMGFAEKLSDDPILLQSLGSRFKVIVDYDVQLRRITYSFRTTGDVGSDEQDAKMI